MDDSLPKSPLTGADLIRDQAKRAPTGPGVYRMDGALPT